MSHYVQTFFIPAFTRIKQYPYSRSTIIPCGLDERNQSNGEHKIGLMSSEARSFPLGKLPHAEPQRSLPGPLSSPLSSHRDINMNGFDSQIFSLDQGSHPLPKCQRADAF